MTVYLAICVYDFVVVPVWYGLNRPDLSTFVSYITSIQDPLVQLELMKKMTGQHNPFTLMGGGLFHLAFGHCSLDQFSVSRGTRLPPRPNLRDLIAYLIRRFLSRPADTPAIPAFLPAGR